jgi:hypothetical protein
VHDTEIHAANVAYFGRDGALARATEADEAFAAGRAAVLDCEATPPGPELLAKILTARELPLDGASRITLYGCWERLQAWTAAEQMAALCDAAGGAPNRQSDSWVVTDVALSTGLSEHTIGGRLATTRFTSEALPVTWEALHRGQITTAHHYVVEQVLRDADVAVAQKVEGIVTPKAVANGWTPSQLRDATRYVLLKSDPDGCEERAARARKSRSDVTFRAQEDMLASLFVTGDAGTVKAMHEEVEQQAEAMRRAGDTRPIGELRVAVMAARIFGEELTPVVAEPEPDVATQEPDTPTPEPGPTAPMPDPTADEPGPDDTQQPAPPARRRTGTPQTLVVMSLSTLLGGNEPAELVGYGPITPAMARRIAGDSVLRRLVCDPLTGRPVDLGRTSYRPSQEQRDWIAVRDRTCLFPACRRPAAHCDVDHEQEWDLGGATDCDNCGLLCRRHHNYKTQKGWDLTRTPDDTSRWDSPHGFVWWRPAATYDVEPDPDADRDTDRLLDPDKRNHHNDISPRAG